MPFVRVWIHFIWATKERANTISPDLKNKLLAHILENAKKKEIWIDSVNCVENHIHLLISLGKEQSISKTAMLVKGESSYWVNRNKLSTLKFAWQEEYIAVSVSESQKEKVREYINNQEEHHRVKSYQEEYEALMKKYGNKIIQ